VDGEHGFGGEDRSGSAGDAKTLGNVSCRLILGNGLGAAPERDALAQLA